MTFDYTQKSSLSSQKTALRVRDAIRQISGSTTEAIVPKPLVGRMITVDMPRLRGTVWFPGDDQPVDVHIFANAVPATWQSKKENVGVDGDSLSGAGSQVLCQRIDGTLYVIQVLSGGSAALDFRALGSSIISQEAADTSAASPGANAAVDIAGKPFETTLNCHISDSTITDGQAIQFGPFTTYDADYPRFGIMEITVQIVGAVKTYKFATNPKIEFSSPYQSNATDVWYRLVPERSINDDDGESWIITSDTNNYDFDLELAFKTTAYGNDANFQSWKELWMRIIKRGTWSGGLDAYVAIKATNIYKARSLGGRELFMQEKVSKPIFNRGYIGFDKAQHAFERESGYFPDNFSRAATTGGWTAGIWFTPTNQPSTFSTDGTKGVVSIQSNGTASEVVQSGGAFTSLEGYATFSVRAIPTGANVRANCIVRWDHTGFGGTTDDRYYFSLDFKTDSTLQLVLRKRVSGTISSVATVATGLSYSANQKVHVHFRIWDDVNAILPAQKLMRAWLDGTREPDTWALNTTDSTPSLTGLGYHGCGFVCETGNTNTKPFIVDTWDVRFFSPLQSYEFNKHQWHTGPFRSGLQRLAQDLQKTWTYDGTFSWNGTYLKFQGKIYLHGVGMHRDGLVSGRAYADFADALHFPYGPADVGTGFIFINWNNGMPLQPEESLWLAIPPGSENMNLSNKFFIVSPSEVLEYHVPEWAILIASRGPSTACPEIRLGNGQVLDKWRAFTLQNSWSNRGAGYPSLSYRMLGSPPNTLQIVGQITGGTLTSGTTIATLPAGFRPITEQNIINNTGHNIAVSSAGNIQVFGGAGSVIQINSMITLDL